jgi:purine/pyrimidine-nucleoside phosphorylase
MFKVNEYYEGKVKSISFHTGDCPASTGVIAPGEYSFNTSTREIMSITSGKMSVRLPETIDWVTYLQGENFTVEAGKKFFVRVEGDTAYLCLYV